MESVRRGYIPSDITEFGPEAEGKLKAACTELCFLLNRGYPVKAASTFVGNHHLLSERQRLALARITSADNAKPNRLAAKLRAKTCELCGAYTNDVEIHQVKRLKNLTGTYEWERVMFRNRRKTLAVCPACHHEIHSKD